MAQLAEALGQSPRRCAYDRRNGAVFEIEFESAGRQRGPNQTVFALTVAMGRPDGLTKVLVDSESERIPGMGVVGVGASEPAI